MAEGKPQTAKPKNKKQGIETIPQPQTSASPQHILRKIHTHPICTQHWVLAVMHRQDPALRGAGGQHA
jgi:hypothetical protein